MVDEVVGIFQKFLDGSQDSFWEFIQHERVSRVLRYQSSLTADRYRLSIEERKDYDHEIILGLLRRLARFEVDPRKDEIHQANSLFSYLKLVLMGESDKAARFIKGIVSRDEQVCASIKGYKFSIDHEVADNENASEDNFSHIMWARMVHVDKDHTETIQAGLIRKLIFTYLSKSGDIRLYQAMVMYYERGMSWNAIASRLNLRTTEKQAYSRKAARLIAIVRAFLYCETDMHILINILGIHTTDTSVAICLLDNDHSWHSWQTDYFTHQDLNTIEGKISDWLRMYDITWVVLSEIERPTQADVVIERILERRSILYTRFDLIDLLPRVPNVEKLKRIRSWDDVQAGAYLVAAGKREELEIARRK